LPGPSLFEWFVADKSPLFREMLANKALEDEEVVKIDDVCPEIVDQFLNYLYTGSLKEEDRNGSNDHDPAWIQMLPDIVRMAIKVAV